MQIKQKKRENIPYLIEKIQRKNIITGLTRVIGTRFLHNKDINRVLGMPAHKSAKIAKLTSTQKKNYVYNLNKYNFLYEDKDREEIDSRLALMTIKSYRQWRYNHGLPCRGQRTKTNASTAHFRTHARMTVNSIKKERSKSNKSFNKTFKEAKKNTYNRTT
jgi:ribosomal protein S13